MNLNPFKPLASLRLAPPSLVFASRPAKPTKPQRKAAPLDLEARRFNYVQQNNGGEMTPRQARRWKKKLRRFLGGAP